MRTTRAEHTMTEELAATEELLADLVTGGGGLPVLLRLRAETVTIVDAVLDGWCEGGTELAPAVAARILVGVQDVVARDLVCVVDAAQRPVAIRLWDRLAADAPPGHLAPPLCIRGLLRWQDGDGRGAIDDACLALDDDEGYRMAELLVQGLVCGLQPEALFDPGGSVAERRQRLSG